MSIPTVTSWYRRRAERFYAEKLLKPKSLFPLRFVVSPSHPGDGFEDPMIPRPKSPNWNQIADEIRT